MGGKLGLSLTARISFIIALSLSAVAWGQNCLTQSEISDIAHHFPQFSNLANAPYCFDGSQTSNLLEGISFMQKTAFAPSMTRSQDELFSGKFAQDWWGYFHGRINEFDVQSDCPKGVAAYVYGFGGNTMYVCPVLLTENFTALDRASVFMHEARHIDGFPHITCRHGARAGIQGACDSKISDQGSYSVTVETYAQLAEYAPNLHPGLRAYARASAVTYADEAFETPVRIDRSQKFLGMNDQREFQLIDLDAGTFSFYGSSPLVGQIVPRGQQLILFPSDKNQTARFVFTRDAGEIKQQAGDIAGEYNSQSPGQRVQLRDVHIGTQWVVRVYADHALFTCDPRSASTSDVVFHGEKGLRLLYPNGYDRASTKIQLMMESGHVYDLTCASPSSGDARLSSYTTDRFFKRIFKSGAKTLALSQDGRLFQIDSNHSTPVANPFDGQWVELVPYQTFTFFDSPRTTF